MIKQDGPLTGGSREMPGGVPPLQLEQGPGSTSKGLPLSPDSTERKTRCRTGWVLW